MVVCHADEGSIFGSYFKEQCNQYERLHWLPIEQCKDPSWLGMTSNKTL